MVYQNQFSKTGSKKRGDSVSPAKYKNFKAHNLHANSEIAFMKSKFIKNFDSHTQYFIHDVIGKGTLGEVWKGTNSDNN